MTAHLDNNARSSTLSLHFSHFVFRSAHKSTLYYVLPSPTQHAGFNSFAWMAWIVFVFEAQGALTEHDIMSERTVQAIDFQAFKWWEALQALTICIVLMHIHIKF